MPKRSKPPLLMISNFLKPPRHNENIWHSLAQRLKKNGYHVITVSARENQVLRLLDMLWITFSKRRQYQLAQIDVFSGKAFIFAEACAALLTRLKKPFILTLHGGRLPEFSMLYPHRVKHLLINAAVVVTPSLFLQNGLASFRSDIKLIPNPINLDATIYRRRDHIKPNLIWVRAFHEIYNPILAVQVLNVLKARFPEMNLTMIGPDKGDGSLEHLLASAEELQIMDRLRVIQGVPHHEIPSLLDRADIFINTSNYDTSPRSLVEAMGNGLCIVTTNVGGIPYLVSDHQEALLVPPRRIDAMSDAIQLLLTNYDLAAKLSYQARKKAEKFDWPAILQHWEKLISKVSEGFYGNI